MGYYCTVPQCTSLAGKTKNVKFHRFPRDQMLANKWNVILKRGKPFTKYSKVCSLHFTQADYNVTTMGQWKTLSKDAIPSQNLPKLNPDGTVMVIRKSRTVKYKEIKKEEQSIGDKVEKWSTVSQTTVPMAADALTLEQQDSNLAYRLQALNSIANNITQQQQQQQQTIQQTLQVKPKKQDAIMQTDPVLSEEDDQLTFSESEKSTNPEVDYGFRESYDDGGDINRYDAPKDFSKLADDYIPQTNEEYNKEAEKYALERKSHHDQMDYRKPILENGYRKIEDVYYEDKEYGTRQEFAAYPGQCQDSVELLRNQQHNLQMLQEQHRINENQNFFNESHIKQEMDFGGEEEKFLYERNKEQIDQNVMYDNHRRVIEQQRILDQIQQQVKQEPDVSSGCENVMQPQSSPYYTSNATNNVTASVAGIPEGSRPGPELLIAKQNALAAHTQLWQNTMKRPFFYSESPHYNSSQLLHRYEDLSRILQ